jgi:DNA-binding ferritin-like protein (Dps family)
MLRILDHPWHQAHAYRLHALPADFYMATVYHDHHKTIWNVNQRPRPANLRGALGVREAEQWARQGRFDLVLCHLDQWCDSRMPWRGMPFIIMCNLAEKAGVPCIAIMHGTPDDAANRRDILRLIGDLPVIVNSHQAAREWDAGEKRASRYGLPQFRAIIHGYDVDEFDSYPLDRREVIVSTICSGGEMSRTYHGLPLVERLAQDIPLALYGKDGNRPWLNDYGEYRDELRRMLVYLSPTRRGPMPGARTEAMLSGACVVTVPGNDVETFIDHGRTGFIVDTYEDVRDTCRALLAEPERAYRIGQLGRESARKLFDKSLYVADWLSCLEALGITANPADNLATDLDADLTANLSADLPAGLPADLDLDEGTQNVYADADGAMGLDAIADAGQGEAELLSEIAP